MPTSADSLIGYGDLRSRPDTRSGSRSFFHPTEPVSPAFESESLVNPTFGSVRVNGEAAHFSGVHACTPAQIDAPRRPVSHLAFEPHAEIGTRPEPTNWPTGSRPTRERDRPVEALCPGKRHPLTTRQRVCCAPSRGVLTGPVDKRRWACAPPLVTKRRWPHKKDGRAAWKRASPVSTIRLAHQGVCLEADIKRWRRITARRCFKSRRR